MKTLLERQEYRLAHDLARERLAAPDLDLREQAECALIACFSASRLGDEAEAIAQGEAAYITAKLTGDHDLLGQAMYNSAHAYNRAGLYAKALDRIAEFETYKAHFSAKILAAFEVEAVFAAGVIYRNLNQLSDAREQFETAYDLAVERGLPKVDEYRANLVDVMLRQSDSTCAAALIQAGEDFHSDSPEAQALHDLRQTIARAHYSLRVGATTAAYDLCVEALAADPMPELRAQVLKLLHDLAVTAGQTEEALGLALLAAQAASEANRRDLLEEAEKSAVALAQGMTSTQLEQLLAQLRSVTFA